MKGITFKENVSDIRNSKVIDLIFELKDYGLVVDVMDPNASFEEVKSEYKLQLIQKLEHQYDVLILAVAHDEYRNETLSEWIKYLKPNPVIFDIKSLHTDLAENKSLTYMNL